MLPEDDVEQKVANFCHNSKALKCNILYLFSWFWWFRPGSYDEPPEVSGFRSLMKVSSSMHSEMHGKFLSTRVCTFAYPQTFMEFFARLPTELRQRVFHIKIQMVNCRDDGSRVEMKVVGKRPHDFELRAIGSSWDEKWTQALDWLPSKVQTVTIEVVPLRFHRGPCRVLRFLHTLRQAVREVAPDAVIIVAPDKRFYIRPDVLAEYKAVLRDK